MIDVQRAGRRRRRHSVEGRDRGGRQRAGRAGANTGHRPQQQRVTQVPRPIAAAAEVSYLILAVAAAAQPLAAGEPQLIRGRGGSRPPRRRVLQLQQGQVIDIHGGQPVHRRQHRARPLARHAGQQIDVQPAAPAALQQLQPGGERAAIATPPQALQQAVVERLDAYREAVDPGRGAELQQLLVQVLRIRLQRPFRRRAPGRGRQQGGRKTGQQAPQLRARQPTRRTPADVHRGHRPGRHGRAQRARLGQHRADQTLRQGQVSDHYRVVAVGAARGAERYVDVERDAAALQRTAPQRDGGQ